MDRKARRTRLRRRRCLLCDARFKNIEESTEHYASAFHKFMSGIKRTQLTSLGTAKTLKDQIVEIGKKEPLIGLEYIYEYDENAQGIRIYECKLCRSSFKDGSIFFHIVGIRHRIAYLVSYRV
ncbi:hypothetical protein GDO81_014777 [Engystomops pustulosus]|uniref:C2H2-type domain-containing protein n=1 Tax=Engystomops pustulosus TaxID=76066 RepID=A0AAV7AJ64_ENGPU|nr:hypothetical protein GDO81_014777 [Engystomops pustulosus]